MKKSSVGARETIAKRNKTRGEIKQLQDEIRDMQQLYEKEKSRKKVVVHFFWPALRQCEPPFNYTEQVFATRARNEEGIYSALQPAVRSC